LWLKAGEQIATLQAAVPDEARAMTAIRYPFAFLLALTAVLAPACAPAQACNIPVFRYAIDHWPSDPYRLTVFHRGPLAAEHRDALQALEKQADGDFPAIVLELVDLAKNPGGAEDLPTPPADAELPWLVVRYPTPTRIEVPIWSGPLRAEVAAALLDSPARREIARRIRGGDSAVWVLLASGDPEKDAAAEKLLRVEVQRLARELKLPERADAPEDQLPDERPMKLAFSVLRVARNDPAEAMLVRMLLNTEDDLPGRSDPMVFPVFGRGRAMPALVGAGITTGNIEDAARFLAGPCSCEVKRDNPGVDLLLTADWGSVATNPASGPPVPAGTTVPIPRPSPPPAKEVLPPAASEPPSASPRALLLAAIGVAGVLAAFTGTMVLRSRRRVSQ
jgi:hypothetical protein